jgi:golgi SNAP receptor complex member 2
VSRRVQKFRTDYVDLKAQFEKLKTQAVNEVRRMALLYRIVVSHPSLTQKTASQRNELFASSNAISPSTAETRRRWGPGPSSPTLHSESPFRGPTPVPAAMPNAGLRENHALDEHTFLQSTEARLDEFLAQGQDVLNNLVDQRNVLKGTQKRLLDAANTLGLSRDVIGWIERRRYRVVCYIS